MDYAMMYLTDLRKERKHLRQEGNDAEIKLVDAELVKRAQDRYLKHAHNRDSKQLLEQLHKETYDNLMLYEETDQKKLAEGSYKFIITNGAMAHTAFHTEAGLNRWQRDTGINFRLKGKYTVISMSGNIQKLDAFAKKHNLRPSKILDNGEYTRAYIKEGKNGNTIYHLNPNYPREILPYKQE